MNEVLNGFKHIVETSGRIPQKIWMDEDKEYYNTVMDKWTKTNNIIRYSTFGKHKAAILKRFNRTLKTKMSREFTANNNHVWIDGKLD